MTEVAQATGDANVAESIIAKLTAERAAPSEGDENKPEAAEQAEAETEATEESASEGEPEEAEEPAKPQESDPDDQEFEIDGRKITLKELKRGHLRERDYTRKTQAVSAKERELATAVETERKQTKDYLDQVDAFVQMVDPLKAYEKLDWMQLARDDQANGTNNYTLLKAQYDQLKDGLGKLGEARKAADEKSQRENQSRMAAWTKEQVEIIQERHPEIRDAKKAKAITAEMDAYASTVGFTDAELKGFPLFRDARMWRVFRDASSFQKGEAARKSAEGKKTVNPSPVIKPKGGEAKPGSTSAETRAFKTQIRNARSDREKAEAIIARLHRS